MRSRSPRHRNCGVRARDQAARKKGLHPHTPIGPLLPPDDPNAFACAAPWRQQRSRGPLPRKPAIPAAEGVPSALRPSTATAPAFASAHPRHRASEIRALHHSWREKRRRPVTELPPRISTSTPSTISASTTPAARTIRRGRRYARTRQPSPRWTDPMPCIARFRSTAPNAGATRTRRRVDQPPPHRHHRSPRVGRGGKRHGNDGERSGRQQPREAAVLDRGTSLPVHSQSWPSPQQLVLATAPGRGGSGPRADRCPRSAR